jgi:flagellar basal body P-ring formation protein FlgA
MKQASNSLLTYFATPFIRMPHAQASREKASVYGRRFAHFLECQEKMNRFRYFLLGLSCVPRDIVRIRLHEGRIRSLLYGMAMAFVLLVSGQMLVPNLTAGERLLIYLKEEASIASSNVLLKDVADLRGPDVQQIEKLAQTTIAESPVFGETAVVNRHQIEKIVQGAVGFLPSGTFAGATAVRIRVQGRQITADEINPILKSHILQTTSWKESEISIRSMGNLKGIELPPTGAEFRILTSSAVIGSRNLLVPLEILQDGKILRSYWITAEIGVRAEVLTAARRIPAGKMITLDDIEIKFAEIPDLRASYACDPKDVLGKVSRRSFLPGFLLTGDAFANPLLVRSGETVRLQLERDGIMLTSLAKAEQDGRLGQLIRVRSLDFSTFLKAQVTGRAEVRMR